MPVIAPAEHIHFSKAEFAERHSRTVAAMQAAGLPDTPQPSRFSCAYAVSASRIPSIP